MVGHSCLYPPTKPSVSDQNEPFVTVPGLAGGAVGTKYDWNVTYTANAQLKDRVVSIPLGKVVGGSTKLNRMVFDRGAQSDYDTWETLGNRGWNFQSFLYYFKKVCRLVANSMNCSHQFVD